MEHKFRPLRLLAVATALTSALVASWVAATYTYNTDFPPLYRAGRVVLDPNNTRAQIYDPDVARSVPVPEATTPEVAPTLRFVWPAFAADLIAGIAWLPYFPAKAAMVFLNMVSYVIALMVFADSLGVRGNARRGTLLLCCLWPPFFDTLRFAQVNALLLLSVVLACLAARRRHPLLSGVWVAVASAVKVFPLAVSPFLGLIDFRITVAAVLAFSLLLAGQPLGPWLSAMAATTQEQRAVVHHTLSLFDQRAPVAFTALVMMVGFAVAIRRRRLGYEWLASFGIVTTLLAMPMAEYYHLTLAIIGYLWLVVRNPDSCTSTTAATTSFVFVWVAYFASTPMSLWITWVGLVVLWLGLSLSGLRSIEARETLGPTSGPNSRTGRPPEH